MPDDAEHVLRNTNGVHGSCGDSSFGRLLTEIAVKKQTGDFKAIRF